MDNSSERAVSRFLRRIMRHSALTQQEQEAILSLDGRSVQIQAYRDVVLPGEDVGYACLVVEGLVGRFDQMADGSRQTVACYIRGDMAGLQSVVLPAAGWGITALSTSTILKIPHNALREIATRFPAITTAFWRETAVNAGTLAKWVANVGRKSAHARLAHLLCEMGLRMEEAELGTRGHFHLPLTQAQLGEALGLTPVHVNRMVRLLREEGAVSFRQSEVKVLDLELLQSIAGFDPKFFLLGPA